MDMIYDELSPKGQKKYKGNIWTPTDNPPEDKEVVLVYKPDAPFVKNRMHLMIYYPNQGFPDSVKAWKLVKAV